MIAPIEAELPLLSCTLISAEIVEITEEYRGEHSTVWLSRESAKYLAETDHPTDKARANVLDEDFMQMILKFYEKAIG